MLRSLKDEASYKFWCYIDFTGKLGMDLMGGWLGQKWTTTRSWWPQGIRWSNFASWSIFHDNFYSPSWWQGYCPNEVMGGFDRDSEEDSSLRLECTIPLADLQDPGVPTSPLNEAQANRWFWLSCVMCISAKQMRRFLVNHREEL